jgi:hypothetical protein
MSGGAVTEAEPTAEQHGSDDDMDVEVVHAFALCVECDRIQQSCIPCLLADHVILLHSIHKTQEATCILFQVFWPTKFEPRLRSYFNEGTRTHNLREYAYLQADVSSTCLACLLVWARRAFSLPGADRKSP